MWATTILLYVAKQQSILNVGQIIDADQPHYIYIDWLVIGLQTTELHL
jgi:hypothetical protein